MIDGPRLRQKAVEPGLRVGGRAQGQAAFGWEVVQRHHGHAAPGRCCRLQPPVRSLEPRAPVGRGGVAVIDQHDQRA